MNIDVTKFSHILNATLVRATLLTFAACLTLPAAAAEAPRASTVSIIHQAIEHVTTQDRSTAPTEINDATPTVNLQTDKPGVTLEHDGLNFTLSLEAPQPGEPSITADSSTFTNVDADTDAAVLTTPSGAQLLAVMHSANASQEQRYRLDLPAHTQLHPKGDGGFLLVESAENIIGSIDAPWAIDASGKRLPTFYRLEDQTLIQYTETAGATFPVVADPKVTYGLSIYVRYQKSEVKDFKSKGLFVGAAALAGAACAKIPVGWLVAACAASIAVVSESVLDTFESAADRNRCIELQFNYQGIIKSWKTKTTGSWCK